MKNIYIGTRASYEDMSETLGRGVVRLNQSLSTTCRQVAMDKGIKQTEKGKRLEFYSVTSEEFEKLTEEFAQPLAILSGKPVIRPLVVMDEDLMDERLNAINSKPQYSRSMLRPVYKQYKKDLRIALADSITKIGDDLGSRKVNGGK